MRKVFLCIPSLYGGGSERVFSYLLDKLDKHRFIVELVVLKYDGHLPSFVRNRDVTVHNLNCRLPKAFVKLPFLLAKEKPDIVVSTICYMNIVLGISSLFLRQSGQIHIARESGIPSVRVLFTKSMWNSFWMYRFAYRFVDRVICQSVDMAAEVHSLYHVPQAKITTIPNPVDVAYLKALASEMPPASYLANGYNILAVGRLQAQKAYDLLIRSLSLVRSTGTHLHILGSGHELERLSAQARLLSVENRITFHGHVENPYSFMKHANLFVMTSIAEGFPNSLLEALSFGCPAVAFDGLGGVKELIKDGLNGMLIESGDVNAFANAIDCCLSNRFNSNIIAEDIVTNYGVDKIVSLYENTLVSCIEHQDDRF